MARSSVANKDAAHRHQPGVPQHPFSSGISNAKLQSFPDEITLTILRHVFQLFSEEGGISYGVHVGKAFNAPILFTCRSLRRLGLDLLLKTLTWIYLVVADDPGEQPNTSIESHIRAVLPETVLPPHFQDLPVPELEITIGRPTRHDDCHRLFHSRSRFLIAYNFKHYSDLCIKLSQKYYVHNAETYLSIDLKHSTRFSYDEIKLALLTPLSRIRKVGVVELTLPQPERKLDDLRATMQADPRTLRDGIFYLRDFLGYLDEMQEFGWNEHLATVFMQYYRMISPIDSCLNRKQDRRTLWSEDPDIAEGSAEESAELARLKSLCAYRGCVALNNAYQRMKADSEPDLNTLRTALLFGTNLNFPLRSDDDDDTRRAEAHYATGVAWYNYADGLMRTRPRPQEREVDATFHPRPWSPVQSQAREVEAYLSRAREELRAAINLRPERVEWQKVLTMAGEGPDDR